MNARGWEAELTSENFGKVGLYLGRSTGADAWQVATGTDEHGNLVLTDSDPSVSSRPLLWLPRGAEVALAAACEPYGSAEAWRARFEELRARVDVEQQRVDRVLTWAGERRG